MHAHLLQDRLFFRTTCIANEYRNCGLGVDGFKIYFSVLVWNGIILAGYPCTTARCIRYLALSVFFLSPKENSLKIWYETFLPWWNQDSCIDICQWSVRWLFFPHHWHYSKLSFRSNISWLTTFSTSTHQFLFYSGTSRYVNRWKISKLEHITFAFESSRLDSTYAN